MLADPFRRDPAGAIRRWWPGLLIALVLVLAGPAAAQEEPAWQEAETSVVLSDLEGPIDVAIGPEGGIWWNEFYSGNVTRWDPGQESTEVVFHADPIPDPVERGMLGLALDPDVASNGVFYVYYTVADPDDPDGGTNYLSRVEDRQEERLLDVPAFKRHNGGRITLDGEGRLFVSTGDNMEGHPAQDPGSRLGKILHLHPNGTPASDTLEGSVYSLGHRNVYGLAYDETNDRLFATENNDRERDEVNLVEAGNNYGWPHCQGTLAYDYERGEPTDQPCEDPDFVDPLAEFHEDYTVAPTGAATVDGDLYWAAWNTGEIHHMTEANATGEWRDRVVYETDGRINDVAIHDGDLYYANWTAIVRIDAPFDSSLERDLDGRSDTEGEGELPGKVPTVAPLLVVAVLAGIGVGLHPHGPRRDR